MVTFRLFLLLSLCTQTISLDQICDLNQNICSPGTVYNCSDTECTLYCNGTNSCYDIEFYCDDTYIHNECNIICATSNSCTETYIYSHRDTKLQCLSVDSCITNSTSLSVYNNDNSANIYANVTLNYENVINNEHPNILCEGSGVKYCAIHCIGSDSQCQTYPPNNPTCNFIDGNYECNINIVAPNIHSNDKLIVGQLLEFNHNKTYKINDINIPFMITDNSYKSNFINNMEFYIIETENTLNINYLSMLSFCNSHSISSLINIFSPIQHTNMTFMFAKDAIIINKTNSNHKFAWILLFGCNNSIMYSDSMNIETQSIYSGIGKNTHFMGIESIAYYNGIVGLPHGYDYKFNMSMNVTDDIKTNIITSKPITQITEYTTIIYASYTMYGFICFCVFLSFIGYCYSWYSGADNINIFSVILFGIYTWDFYTDIIFAMSLLIYIKYYLFILSCVFIIVPFIINFATLFVSYHKWITDTSIQVKVSEWLVHWNILLMFLTLISGSAFAAVELVNCNLFPLEMFSMGLTARHIKKFSNKRLYSTVLLENIPQIAINIYYTFSTVKSLANIPQIALLAFITSILSINVSIIDIYSTKRMFKTIAKSASAGMKQLYYIEIGGKEIENKKKILLQKPNSIKLAFAEICEIEPRTVNVILCIAIQGGIRIAFEVHSQIFQSKSSVEMLELLRNSIYNLSQSIKTAWKLDAIPNINVIDLVGEDEKISQLQKHKDKNKNFSIVVKRSSISSNRFFSIALNNEIEQQQMQQEIQMHTQPIQPLPMKGRISMQAIKQINLEKEAMDRRDGNSSYCGSIGELNIGTELNEHKPLNALYLKPNDSISQKKYKSKKRRKKNKKNKSGNNLSIAVEPPSSYNESAENMHRLELMNAGSITDTSMSIETMSDSESDSDMSMNEPLPKDNNNKPVISNVNSDDEISVNTINIVINSANDNNVEMNNGTDNEMRLKMVNNDSTSVQMPASRSNSVTNSNKNKNNNNISPNMVPSIPNTHPIMNDRLSLEEQYIQPTLANIDSYNDTEAELNDIMMNVIVEQHKEIEAPTTLAPILEDHKNNNINVEVNDDNNELEYNEYDEEDEEDQLELGNSFISNSNTNNILIENTMQSDIPSTLPPILESNLDLTDININNVNGSNDMVSIENDEEDVLEIQSVDTMSTYTNTNNILNNNAITPSITPIIQYMNPNINKQMTDQSITPQTSFKNPITPVIVEHESFEEKQTKLYSDTPTGPPGNNINTITNTNTPTSQTQKLRDTIYSLQNDNTQTPINNQIVAENVENVPNHTHQIQYSLQLGSDDSNDSMDSSDSNDNNNNNNNNNINRSQPVIRIQSEPPIEPIQKHNNYRPRTNTLPGQLVHKIKKMPAHKLPPGPRKNTAPLSVLNKPLPFKPLPQKPLPQKPLPQRKINSNRITNY